MYLRLKLECDIEVFKVSVFDQDNTVYGTNMGGDLDEVVPNLHFVAKDHCFPEN